MQVELKVNDKSVQAEISEEQLKKMGIFEQLKELGLVEDKPKTGYERVKKSETYYVIDTEYNSMSKIQELNEQEDEQYYNTGNYYSDETIAENNARADRLQRCLRQWQAQNDKPISMSDWKNNNISKYYVDYDCFNELFFVTYAVHRRFLNNIYFTSEEKAKEAIEVFNDELLWYFVEYQQRLDEE